MPLFSEHISNMYYSGSPSYSSPSYGYKSSYNPLGTSYSASYLSPGGSYSNHSSISSYSRAPLSSRWIPGLSRSYSPMLTPISERGTASPIRINSPRRIPISKRCYGTPSYIQRPININTESIDVSRNRYRPKPAEAAQPASSSLSRPQNDNPAKDNEKSPFMPRIDGKPETGIDSSPGLQRSTIKRGRTVVRLHTIKRKDRDSPRKPIETSQLPDGEINKQDASETLGVNLIPEEPKELRWREKLSEDLVYVDKKEKKSLGTKLVEKFIVKDVIEKENKIEKSDIKSSEEASKSLTEMLSPSSEVQSTSKSPDRRCSMELLAEQSSLLDSLIRGENLSTATLDLSKVGVADESKNKLVSSNSIKRRKTDDKGNPLKTTKSDHSLHDNLKKSLKGNKESKSLTKRQSLKKSQSGGSIYRLDSITEFPKEPVDLPAIPENKLSPKETKTEQKPKLKTKITASVEISPPISPLKFRIENVVVEEKHHAPKKEISFSYDVDELLTQDVTLQGPKTTLRRTKERNSVKKKSKKTDPTSPEPDDGNFWAKIGKRETVYLIKRKQNIEAAKEAKKRAYFWLDGDDEESGDVSNVTNDSNVSIETSNDPVNIVAGSELPLEPEPNIIPTKAKKVNIADKKDGNLNTISKKLGKSRSSDSMHNVIAKTHSTSLKEKTTKHITEPKHEDETSKQILNENVELIEDVTLSYTEKNKIEETTDSNLREKATLDNQIHTNLKTQETVHPEISKTISLSTKTVSFDESAKTNTDIEKDLKQKFEVSEDNEIVNSKISLNLSVESPDLVKTTFVNSTEIYNTQGESHQKNLKNDSKSTSNIDKIKKPKVNIDLNSYPETLSRPDSTPVLKTPAKSEGKNEKDLKDISEKTEIIELTILTKPFAETSTEKETKPVNTASATEYQAKNEDKNFKKILKPILSEKTETIASVEADVNVNLASETLPYTETKSINNASTSQTQAKSKNLEKDSKIIPKQNETQPKPVISLATLQIQTKSENKNLDKNFPHTSEILETVDSAKTNFDVDTSGQTHKSKEKVSNVSTLQAQAKRKVEEKTIEALPKNKQLEKTEDVNTISNKQRIPESLKKAVLTDTTKIYSKKKIKKVQVKTPENKAVIIEKLSSDQKDNVCETCKKSLGSDSSENNKVIIKKIKDQSTSKQLQGKDKIVEINAGADKSINNVKEAKSSLDNSVANSSNLDFKPETSASTSQIPIVIETKNIPNETIASDTDQAQTSTLSQKKTGEENKSENNTKLEENPKVKQSSIKKVISPKKLKKEDKPLKPLIATPRPLLKRVPQVIHSDSSESSSEDSSEEEESDESENSGEFYECENNPDGRTSTGSNDSGFDSSAPTSPASFLHIKKGGGDSPGPSSSNTPSQLPATDVVDSELELEQSTAYGLFRKTGRFTPPARSIPRFRKYNIEDFQFIKVLGKGSFGKVLLAELRDTEYYYAVKCLKKDVVLEDDDVECTLIERKVLALGTNHPYLCHLFATFQTDSHLFFVMEYLNGGDLMFHIQQSGRFPEARARFYAAEIVSGLKFLHKRGIVYRDLKLDNILLDFDGNVRIADFGMCKLQIYLDKTADTFCGTPDYMAPEIIKGLKYNQTVDWWSFGVLLYEMLIGQSPFSGCDEDELFWSICNEMPSYPRFLSREALTILTRLLDKDAKTRLGGTECMHGDIREQDFFQPVHWDKLERRELETPFKPRVRHPLDTQYFDRAFTGERPRLTAVEPHVLRSMDQEPFRGFSYTNPNATDR